MRSPDEVKKFMSWYSANLSETSTCAEAYSLTETIWSEEFGSRFYKSYESFRAAKSYYNKVSKHLIG